MTRSIGAIILGVTLMFGGSVAIDLAAARSYATLQKPQIREAADLSARQRIRHPARYAYRAYAQPHYYDRPDDYRPYPYALPAPFFLGLASGRGNGRLAQSWIRHGLSFQGVSVSSRHCVQRSGGQ